MRDPFANYDAWLEAPYVNASKEQDAFESFCEVNNLDPDEAAWIAFENEKDEVE